jgi:HEAT repeat protein
MLQRISRGFVVVACAALLSLIIPTMMPETPAVEAQDALGSVRDGLREYKRGNWQEAIGHFDRALARNPTDAEAKRIRDEIGLELAQDFLRANFADGTLSGRFQRFGKWVLAARPKTDPIGRNNDPESIRDWVDRYMMERDPAVKLLRAQNIRDSYGDFAVPYIRERYMHHESADSRYEARALLAIIGQQALDALVQVMYSPEAHDRQTAALALGDIGDPRALPVLAKHFQDTNEVSEVREACRAAIQAIRADMPERDRQVSDAKDLFYLQAEGYYRNNAAGRFWRNRLVGGTYQGNLPVVLYNYDRSYTVWKWVPGAEPALQSQEVPLWAYADILAEESAMQAIDLGIQYSGGDSNWVRDAEALLTCIHMHMYTEGRARYFLSDANERDFIVNMLGERGFVPNLHGYGLGASSSTPVLYTALERSLGDGYPAVSMALCDAIADLGDSNVIGTNAAAALVRALNDPDKNISYAAARALIRLGARKDTGVNPDVEAVAVRNLQEVSARSVLVIAEEESLRNRYLSVVADLGFSGTGARTLEEGADLATQGPPWDAIIVQGELAVAPVSIFEMPAVAGAVTGRERAESLFQILANDIRTAAVPVLIAVQDTERNLRMDQLRDLGLAENRFVSYRQEADFTVDAEALRQTLDFIWEASIEDAKGKTNESVVLLAQALADLDPGETRFNVEVLLAGLAGGLRLDGRSWQARRAISYAIAVLVADQRRVGASWVRANVIPNLIDTVTSESRVDRPAVKGAAAKALGSAYAAHRGAWDEDGFNALREMLRLEYDLSETSDEDLRNQLVLEVFDARNAAGAALGRAPTTASQRQTVRRQQAVNPHAPHPDRRAAD